MREGRREEWGKGGEWWENEVGGLGEGEGEGEGKQRRQGEREGGYISLKSGRVRAKSEKSHRRTLNGVAHTTNACSALRRGLREGGEGGREGM